MATAGDVVFGSDASYLVALDASSGNELWRFNAGAPIQAAPVAYQAGGRDIIAVAAGGAVIAFGLK
jgi:alcohol dehydrogenase (cytochrome c)